MMIKDKPFFKNKQKDYIPCKKHDYNKVRRLLFKIRFEGQKYFFFASFLFWKKFSYY